MAVGKNKRISKGSKKGGKKKIIDPFTRKEWYSVKAPIMFKKRNFGKTMVNRTQGTRIASEGLKGRVFEVVQADLNGDDIGHRKFKLIADEVQQKDVLTNFYGMELTRDKICSMVRKWQSLIEAHVDVKTTDGYLLRVFCIGFCRKRENSLKKCAYAYHSQIREIRAKMVKIIQKEISSSDIKDVVYKLIADSINKDIEKQTQSIYPLHDVHIKKVKVLRRPKADIGKLLELHDVSKVGGKEGGDVDMTEVERPDGWEPEVAEEV